MSNPSETQSHWTAVDEVPDHTQDTEYHFSNALKDHIDMPSDVEDDSDFEWNEDELRQRPYPQAFPNSETGQEDFVSASSPFGRVRRDMSPYGGHTSAEMGIGNGPGDDSGIALSPHEGQRRELIGSHEGDANTEVGVGHGRGELPVTPSPLCDREPAEFLKSHRGYVSGEANVESGPQGCVQPVPRAADDAHGEPLGSYVNRKSTISETAYEFGGHSSPMHATQERMREDSPVTASPTWGRIAGGPAAAAEGSLRTLSYSPDTTARAGPPLIDTPTPMNGTGPPRTRTARGGPKRKSTPLSPNRRTPTPARMKSDKEPEPDPMAELRDKDGYAPYFSTYEEARRTLDAHLKASEELDSTIPTTNEQKQALVKTLYQAVMDMSTLPEQAPGSKVPSAVKKLKGDEKKNWAQEKWTQAICWEVLELCIKRQGNVGPLVPDWQRGSRKAKDFRSFKHRFDTICEAVKLEKSIPKRLLDPFVMLDFVDDPPFYVRRTQQNKVLNTKKGDYIQKGRRTEAEENGGVMPSRKTAGRKRKVETPNNGCEEPDTSELAVAEPSLGGQAAFEEDQNYTEQHGPHGITHMRPLVQINQPSVQYDQEYQQNNQYLIQYDPPHHENNQLSIQPDQLYFQNQQHSVQHGHLYPQNSQDSVQYIQSHLQNNQHLVQYDPAHARSRLNQEDNRLYREDTSAYRGNNPPYHGGSHQDHFDFAEWMRNEDDLVPFGVENRRPAPAVTPEPTPAPKARRESPQKRRKTSKD